MTVFLSLYFKDIQLVVFFLYYAAPSVHETATEAELVFPLGAGLFLSSGFINRFTKRNRLLLLFYMSHTELYSNASLLFNTAPLSSYLNKRFWSICLFFKLYTYVVKIEKSGRIFFPSYSTLYIFVISLWFHWLHTGNLLEVDIISCLLSWTDPLLCYSE